MALGACANDTSPDGTLPSGEYPLELTGRMATPTRGTTDGTWTGRTDDELSLYVNDEGGKPYYLSDDAGTIKAKPREEGGEPYYWQSKEEVKRIKAWYPKRQALETGDFPRGGVARAQVDELDYVGSDFLYAERSLRFTDSPKSLYFRHLVARIRLDITNSDGTVDLSGAITVRLLRTLVAYSFSGTDTIIATGDPVDIIPYRRATPTAGYLLAFEALIPPQNRDLSAFIEITTAAGERFVYTPTHSREVMFGCNGTYTYRVDVRRGGMTVVQSGDDVGWTAGETGLVGSARTYHICDYYPDPNVVYDNGVLISGTPPQGIVFWLDEDAPGYIGKEYRTDGRAIGSRGKIVGFQRSAPMPYSTTDHTVELPMGAGLANMKIVQDNGLFDAYAPFGYVHGLNPAETLYESDERGVWYLPAANELADLNRTLDRFNSQFVRAGVPGFDANDFYWSSSKISSGYGVYVLSMPQRQIVLRNAGGGNNPLRSAYVRPIMLF
jgi:hypothetical protein